MNKLADANPPAAVDHTWFSQAALDVTAERRRQVEKEGWTPEHDDEHSRGELALAAACYAYPGLVSEVALKDGRGFWPWHVSDWKPKDARNNLVRAGALILAEIERLDRAIEAHASRVQSGSRAADPQGDGGEA